MRFRSLSEADHPALDALLDRCAMGTVYADRDWGRVLEASGWRATLVGVEDQGQIVASALAARRRVPLAGWSIEDLHGSLVGTDPAGVRLLLRSLLDRARAAGALRLRVAVKHPAAETQSALGAALRDLLPAAPERSLRGEDHGTYWLDLRGEPASWGPESWNAHNRRNLRKGQRGGVEIRQGREPGSLELFESIYRDTYRRKGLETKPAGFFSTLEPLFRRGRVVLFFAHHGGQAIACSMLGMGRTCRYLWGGSLDAGTGAPPAGPLLHLAMMQHGADSGAATYDLGGSPGPEPVEGHPNHGVWRFKRGFNGRYVEFEEEYDLVLRPLRDKLLEAARSRLARRRAPSAPGEEGTAGRSGEAPAASRPTGAKR